MGDKVWKEIEEEFKREIGATSYNKVGWMQNKPALFKIIKRKCKNMPKAKVASVETTNMTQDNNTDDEFDLELEDGSILKVQPKFKGSGSSWKQNFAQKFNLRQSGNNRWQQRRNNSNQQQRNQNHNNNRGNNAEQQKQNSPSADQTWRCIKCRDDGNPRKFRGDQMCPKHRFRPKWFNNIPIAAVKEVKPAPNGQATTDNTNGGDPGTMASIRQAFYAGYGSEDYSE